MFLVQSINNSFSGVNGSVIITSITDGGIDFNPIQGDMLRTAHNMPQVNKKNFKISFLMTKNL